VSQTPYGRLAKGRPLGGTNRGGYVSGSAQNPSSNPFDLNPPQHGYGGIVHDLAHPGNSSPNGSPGNPGGVGSTK